MPGAAPPGYQTPVVGLRTVVVGFDGSLHSITALRPRAELREARAERLLLEAVGRPGLFNALPQLVD